jgi:hypothetical protein
MAAACSLSSKFSRTWGKSDMARILLEPTMNRIEIRVYPCIGATFHLTVGISGDSSERRGPIGMWRYVEVLGGVFFWSLEEAIFRFYESEISFEPVLHWTNPLTFPGWTEHSRGAGGVKGGCAAATRSRPLTPPSPPRHIIQISGECHSQFPLTALRTGRDRQSGSRSGLTQLGQ